MIIPDLQQLFFTSFNWHCKINGYKHGFFLPAFILLCTAIVIPVTTSLTTVF